MAYTFSTNLPVGKPPYRTFDEIRDTWRWFRVHHFTAEVATAAQSVNELITNWVGVTPHPTVPINEPLKDRSKIIITNCDDANILYVSLFSNVSSTKYGWVILPGGYLELPLVSAMTAYIIGDGTTVTQIAEVY